MSKSILTPCRYDIYLNRLFSNQETKIDYRIQKNSIIIVNSKDDYINEIRELLISSNKILSKNIYERNLQKLKNINQINIDNYNAKISASFNHEIYFLKQQIIDYENKINVFTFLDASVNKLPKISKTIMIFMLIFSPLFASAIIYLKENINLIKKV